MSDHKKMRDALKKIQGMCTDMATCYERLCEAGVYQIVTEALAMTDEEYKQAARAYYEQLCSQNGPAWRHTIGCGSFKGWFMVNDGPELREKVERDDDIQASPASP